MQRPTFPSALTALTACVAVLTLAGAATAQDRTEMLRLTKRAIELPSNRVQDKITLYSAAIEADDSFFLPYSNRAVAHLNYGQWDRAIADATAAIDLAPENSHPWGVRGRGYAGKRLYAQAFNDLSRALELARTDVESRNLYNDRGNAYYSARAYAKALRDYRQAVGIDESFAKGWNNLALTRLAQGDLDEALQDIDKARQLDPRNARVRTVRGRIHMARGDKSDAKEDLDEAIRLDPADGVAWLERGLFRYANGEFAAARGDFHNSLEQQPSPYAAVFDYLAGARAGLVDDARLRLGRFLDDRSRTDYWPIPALQVLAGRADPSTLLPAARRTRAGLVMDNPEIVADVDERRRERTSEAQYYLAQLAHLNGADPAPHLKEAVAQRTPRVQELHMASIELVGWQQPVSPATPETPSDPGESAGAEAESAATPAEPANPAPIPAPLDDPDGT